MSTGRTQEQGPRDTSSEETKEAAWGEATNGESRWPAVLATVLAIALYVSLPQRLTIGPAWSLPGLEGALLVPLLFKSSGRRHPTEERWERMFSMGLIAVINLANVISLILLVKLLLAGHKQSGHELVFFSIQIWFTNVLVFSLWYWELDRGGPGQRSSPHHRQPDFLFPQMTMPQSADPHWTPSFVDYLYVSFTNATAFSPTDTMPLTEWAKLLMMIQSMASLLTIVLVAARAVNILG